MELFQQVKDQLHVQNVHKDMDQMKMEMNVLNVNQVGIHQKKEMDVINVQKILIHLEKEILNVYHVHKEVDLNLDHRNVQYVL